jgi:hypothetical protein
MASTTRTRSKSRTISGSSAPTSVGQSGHPAHFIIVVALGFIALFLVALMMQIQTNEAFITHAGQVNIYQPDWSILMQIPNLVLGNLKPSEAAATIFGYGIELIYLGFIIGYELLHESVERSGQFMAGLFKTLSWVIVLFNGWTDYNYGSLGGGFWGHLGFALVVSFIVGFFGTIGLYLLEVGWKRM